MPQRCIPELTIGISRVPWKILARNPCSFAMKLRGNPHVVSNVIGDRTMVVEWPTSFDTSFEDETLVFHGFQYLCFQMLFLKGMEDSGTKLNFPDFYQCMMEAKKWRHYDVDLTNVSIIPSDVRKAKFYQIELTWVRKLYDIMKWMDYDGPYYSADFGLNNLTFSLETGITIRRAGAEFKVVNDFHSGFLSLFSEKTFPLLRQTEIRVDRDRTILLVSCARMAFLDEVDAILHQARVIVDKQEAGIPS